MTMKIIKKVVSNKFGCVKCGVPTIYNKTNQWCRKCYDHIYNTTKRNKKAEAARQRLIRQTRFANHILDRTKHKAKKEGRAFNLDLVWIKNELNRGTCSVTNMPFVKPKYVANQKIKRGQWSPSIDRIDNNKGYTKNNCRMVVWMYNLAKNNYRDIDLIEMSLAIVKNILIDINGSNADLSLVKYLDGIQDGLVTA